MDRYLIVFIAMLFTVAVTYFGSSLLISHQEEIIKEELQAHREAEEVEVSNVLINLTEQIMHVVNNQKIIIENQNKTLESLGVENITSNFTDVGKISGLLDKPVEILKVK